MTSSAPTSRSASKQKLCGAIFDSPKKRAQLAETEHLISAPDFWNQPERSQKLMQERKRLEESLASDAQVLSMLADLETLFELSREGEAVAAEVEFEMAKLRERLSA